MLTVLRHPMNVGFTSACRVATGRSAILHMARRWNPDKVFMPAYVPEGILCPFIESSAEIVFYRLTDTLEPLWWHLLSKLFEKGATSRSIVVAIEYFGYPASYASLHEKLPGFDGLTFIDCAHSAFSHPEADVKLSVFNKLLPVTDGAVIYSRVQELDLTLDEYNLVPLPLIAIEAYERHLEQNSIIAMSNEPATVEIALEKSAISYETYYATIGSDMYPRAQSSASRVIEGATDWPAMARSRKHKSRLLRLNTPNRMSVRHDADAQFAHPIRCHGRRDEMVDALNRVGVVAGAANARWDHIPDSDFDFECEFIDDHLLLPIGEDVSDVTILAMAGALKKFK